MPLFRNPGQPSKHRQDNDDDALPDRDARCKSAPKGDAGKGPWPSKPPQGFGRTTGGAAGKGPFKR